MVEYKLPKLGATGSSPVARSSFCPAYGGIRPFPFLRRCLRGSIHDGARHLLRSVDFFPIIFALGFLLRKFNKKVVEIDRGMGNGQRPVFFMNKWTQEFVADVERLAEPLLKAEGVRLIDVEYRREPKGRVLRVFIDKQGGVTLDDCAGISNQLGDILDARTDCNEPYHLEVSSPGIDRPLTKPKHFVNFEGRQAVIRTNRPVEGKTCFKGVLAGCSEATVRLVVDGRPVTIPYETILKAHLDWASS